MNLFFHHVGQQGASNDFPKTVFTKISIDVVRKNIPKDIPIRNEILDELNNAFPKGVFNCWGVPAGAKSVIKSLDVGDAVLLVETTAGPGFIPALGIVKVYRNVELRNLSEALWGNHKFPYVFFFDTEKLNFTWVEFIDEIGYMTNFRPSGQFYRLNKDRLLNYGGVANYVNLLREKHLTEGAKKIQDDKPIYETDPDDAIEDLNKYEESYSFLSETEKKAVIQSRIGQGKFRSNLLNYWKECAITGYKFSKMLRASHIKPWKNSTNKERLDIFNGLMLTPNLDTAFDNGLISFSDDGNILVSEKISNADLQKLGITQNMKLKNIDERHKKYLRFHRKNVFQK